MRGTRRARASTLLAPILLAAGCTYAPTRLVVRPSSRADLDRAVASALAVEFPGLELRDAESGRFVSKARPDPLDPRARWKGFVRVLPGRPDAPVGVEVSVVRERIDGVASGRPFWRVGGADRDREKRLAAEIERALARLASGAP